MSTFPPAKSCAQLLNDELLSYICAGFCAKQGAFDCVKRAIQSLEFANQPPPKGQAPCDKGTDPNFDTQKCTSAEIANLKKNISKIASSVKSIYGEKPTADAARCATLNDPQKCLDFKPPEITVP
jgi:hypothetical protein